MTDYNKIEQSIALLLQPLAAIADVIVLPEVQSGLPIPVQKPRIVVAYSDSEYADMSTSPWHVQDETLHINVEVCGTKLRLSERGVQLLVSAVKTLLLGKVPTDSVDPYKRLSSEISFKSSAYAEQPYNESIWTYILILKVTVPVIAVYDNVAQLIEQIVIETDPLLSDGILDTYLVPQDLNDIA